MQNKPNSTPVNKTEKVKNVKKDKEGKKEKKKRKQVCMQIEHCFDICLHNNLPYMY